MKKLYLQLKLKMKMIFYYKLIDVITEINGSFGFTISKIERRRLFSDYFVSLRKLKFDKLKSLDIIIETLEIEDENYILT